MKAKKRMNHIFISYSSKDRSKAKALANIFEQKGWKVWWDKNITPGKPFDRAISKALDEAICIVVLWSANSVDSPWVLEEAYEGLERKILVPTMIGDTRLPFGYRRIQYVDLTKWKGAAKSSPLQKLLGAIDALHPSKKPTLKPGDKVTEIKRPAIKTKRTRTLSGALDGKTIVFTGALSESRNAHAEKVKTVGAKYVSKISSNTDFLVVGANPGPVKLAGAEKYAVKKIKEKQWLKLLNQAYQRTLENKQLVFTGKLNAPRIELENIVKKLGAKPSHRISGNTDFLIVGENPGKVKLEAAEKYSVKIISEALWKDIVETL